MPFEQRRDVRSSESGRRGAEVAVGSVADAAVEEAAAAGTAGAEALPFPVGATGAVVVLLRAGKTAGTETLPEFLVEVKRAAGVDDAGVVGDAMASDWLNRMENGENTEDRVFQFNKIRDNLCSGSAKQ